MGGSEAIIERVRANIKNDDIIFVLRDLPVSKGVPGCSIEVHEILKKLHLVDRYENKLRELGYTAGSWSTLDDSSSVELYAQNETATEESVLLEDAVNALKSMGLKTLKEKAGGEYCSVEAYKGKKWVLDIYIKHLEDRCVVKLVTAVNLNEETVKEIQEKCEAMVALAEHLSNRFK